MNFVKDTQYVYYNLTNKNTGKKNYGLIDIKTNKVIYNTNEEIISFIPYQSNQMLAITSSSAYKICPFKNSDNTNCVESCSGNFVLDIDGNKCQTECDSNKILLIPQKICNLTCDENYYYKKDNKCGLCKEFDSGAKPYKLINSSECLENFDENIMEYYNENLKLLKCKTGYILEDGQCVPHCYSTCQTCSEYSNDQNDQKCSTCKANYILEGNNCVTSPTTILVIPSTIKEIPPSTMIQPSTVIIPPTTIKTELILAEDNSTLFISTSTLSSIEKAINSSCCSFNHSYHHKIFLFSTLHSFCKLFKTSFPLSRTFIISLSIIDFLIENPLKKYIIYNIYIYF